MINNPPAIATTAATAINSSEPGIVKAPRQAKPLISEEGMMRGAPVPVRLMPHNIEAEMAVLGAIILDGVKALTRVQPILSMTDFYRAPHIEIYRALCKLINDRVNPDIVTLSSELEATGRLTAAGGTNYLFELAEFVPTASNCEHYAQLVKSSATKREAIRFAHLIAESAYSAEPAQNAVLASQEAALKLSSGSRSRTDVSHISDAVTRDIARMMSSDRGISSGCKDLDYILGGIERGTLSIIAAEPSAGKTQLAIQYALSAAKKAKQEGKGKIVVFVTLEMPAAALSRRVIFRLARIDSQEFKHRGNQLTTEEARRYKEQALEVGQLPLYFKDGSEGEVNIDDLANLARRMHIEARMKNPDGGIEALVVDYLQEVRPSASDSSKNSTQEREIASISSNLRQLAVTLNIPVIAVSSMSREGKMRHSGQIEYDAHNVMVLEWMQKKSELDPKSKEPVGIIVNVQKQRDGITGNCKVCFVRQYGFFTDFEDEKDGAVPGGKF